MKTIIDFELPMACMSCPYGTFEQGHQNSCEMGVEGLEDGSVNYKEQRHVDCPLVSSVGIDYKELLERYIAHTKFLLSNMFASTRNMYGAAMCDIVSFTEQEQEILKILGN